MSITVLSEHQRLLFPCTSPEITNEMFFDIRGNVVFLTIKNNIGIREWGNELCLEKASTVLQQIVYLHSPDMYLFQPDGSFVCFVIP